MKSLDQENRLIKVHLILELQTPHKPVRYHKRITWTGAGGGWGWEDSGDPSITWLLGGGSYH